QRTQNTHIRACPPYPRSLRMSRAPSSRPDTAADRRALSEHLLGASPPPTDVTAGPNAPVPPSSPGAPVPPSPPIPPTACTRPPGGAGAPPVRTRPVAAAPGPGRGVLPTGSTGPPLRRRPRRAGRGQVGRG